MWKLLTGIQNDIGLNLELVWYVSLSERDKRPEEGEAGVCVVCFGRVSFLVLHRAAGQERQKPVRTAALSVFVIDFSQLTASRVHKDDDDDDDAPLSGFKQRKLSLNGRSVL